MPGYGDNISVCCCYPDIPHDESIKFMIIGTNEGMNTVLFPSRQEGDLILQSDVNLVNKLPNIVDPLMLFGRNLEIQQVVDSLFSESSTHRFIHIFGAEGVGKSSISNYAARYTLERRKFPDGAYYIEVNNKNSGHGLIAKICQRLLISKCNKE